MYIHRYMLQICNYLIPDIPHLISHLKNSRYFSSQKFPIFLIPKIPDISHLYEFVMAAKFGLVKKQKL